MKILIVSTNRERSPFPVAPLGALSVAAAARGAGHQVDLLDMSFAAAPRRALRHALSARGGYDVVGFSIRNLDNCSYFRPKSYSEQVLRLVEEARRRCGAPLILGGSGFSIDPEGWLRRVPASLGVIGEGERAFVRLLEALSVGASPEGIPGVVSLRGKGSPGRVLDLDGSPAPAHDLCAYPRYLRRGGFVSVQSKRGCPFECIYCVYPQLEGVQYRLRSPQRIADEIASVAGANRAACFFFTDSVFNSPREHALAICQELTGRRLGIRWMAYCNPIGFDAQLARAMAASGCAGIEFGLDAATGKMLRSLGKPFDLREIRASLQSAADARLPFAVHLLFGGPEETVDDVEEAMRFLDSCATPNGVFASLGIRLYAGTLIEKRARGEGVLKPGTDLFEPIYYVSEGLGTRPMKTLDTIARRRAEWTTAVDWSKWSVRAIQKLCNVLGVRPQWRNIRNYGAHMRRSSSEPRSLDANP